MTGKRFQNAVTASNEPLTKEIGRERHERVHTENHQQDDNPGLSTTTLHQSLGLLACMGCLGALANNTACSGSGSTPTCDLSTNPTAGNTLIACIWNSATGGTSTITGGGTWTRLVRQKHNGLENGVEMWIANNATGGATTLNMTNGSSASYHGTAVMEFSGLADSSLVDGTPIGRLQTGLSAGTDVVVTNAVTTTKTNDLIIACVEAASATASAGTGHTAHTDPYTNTVFESKAANAGSITSLFSISGGGTNDVITVQAAFSETPVVQRPPIPPIIFQ